MPGRGTPRHAIRIPDDLWDRAGETAEATGTDRNAAIREFLRWFVREPGAQLPERPEAGEE